MSIKELLIEGSRYLGMNIGLNLPSAYVLVPIEFG
jgi:hypothetical protein